MAMQERKLRLPGCDLLPQPEDAEATLANVGAVQDHEGVRGKLWLPREEIVARSLIGMEAVDVEKVDQSVLKMRQRVIEGRANEAGKRAIARIMEGREIAIDLLGIEAGVLIAFPRVDCKARGGQVQGFHRLAHSRVGHAGMGSEFDDRRWLQHINEPEGERHMLCPC